MSPMVLWDVLYVPRQKRNLVSVSMIEDQGLGASFLDGHVHMFPRLRDHLLQLPLERDEGNCIDSCFSLKMLWHIAAAVSCVSFSIRGWLTCMIQP